MRALFSVALIALCFFGLCKAQSKKLNYLIYNNDNEIGEISAEKFLKEGVTNYVLQTDVSTKKLISIEAKYILKTKYKDKRLVYSFMRNYTNGKEQSYAELLWNGKYYQISQTHKEGDHEKLEGIDEINYSVARLYFDEPLEHDSVFSEKFANFFPLTQVDDHSFELKLPDGRNIYHYENGICVKAEIYNFLASLVFKLQQ